MKRNLHFLKQLVLPIAILLMAGCTGYLENPLKDKETGEDIELIIIDASVFTVRLNVFLNDSLTGAAIVTPATVSFSGKNYSDVINLSGKKKSGYTTTSGFLELAVDPNVFVSEENPLSFTIHVQAAGYPGFSREFLFDSPGLKELKIRL